MKHDVTTSKHALIEAWIRQEIREGRLAPGQKLESENELCARFSVSRTSVRKAIADLTAEGILESRHGVGTFCRGPSTLDNRMVALVCYYSESYIWPRLIAGFDSVIHGAGYNVILGQSELSLEREREVLQRLERTGIRAIAIEPIIYQKDGGLVSNRDLFDEMRARGTEIVFIDDDLQGEGFSSIVLDNAKGGAVAAQYLYERGHRDIAIVRVTELLMHWKRQEAALAFLREKGCEIPPERIVDVLQPYSDELPNKIEALLANPSSRPTAVLCTNDMAAIQLFNIARARGLRVPEDISILGFDNSEFVQQPAVNITTMDNPSRYVGEKAAQILLERFSSGAAQASTRIVINPALVERGSVLGLHS